MTAWQLSWRFGEAELRTLGGLLGPVRGLALKKGTPLRIDYRLAAT